MSGTARRWGMDEAALLRLLKTPGARYEELLIVPAEHALDQLGAASVSLLRWERDSGLLRCVVNIGTLGPGGQRFPTEEVFDLADHDNLLDLSHGPGVGFNRDDPILTRFGAALLARHGHSAALSVPVHLDRRVWGVLWATKDDGRLSEDALGLAARTAKSIAPMIALAERLQQMGQLAFEDPLTGLGNRRRLDDTLVDLLADTGSGCTVVVCDINGLKQVNDQSGHQAGDRVIIAVADALAEAITSLPGGVAARLGGDEFALLIPGAARSPAIAAVEAAAATLRPVGINISCGIAAVPAGTSPRNALAVADGAQYGAKRRGALLMVVSDLDLTGETLPQRRAGDLRKAPAARLTVDTGTAVTVAVQSIADGLADAPSSPRGRLEWLGEHLLAPFELNHWTVSSVDLQDPARKLVVDSMGMRVGRPVDRAVTDLLTDDIFDLAAFPLTERSVQDGGWFFVDVLDLSTDADERTLLEAIGLRYLLAVGFSQGRQGLLLELYGHADDLDLRALGSTVGLAASALLGTTIAQVASTPPR